ncbi:DUF4411 family protein [Microbacteriaceae bacterium VKM Ac-2854]|nr:DUF4411 family protein [Microbacteriaceae bacterium VKM Ac-2854]
MSWRSWLGKAAGARSMSEACLTLLGGKGQGDVHARWDRSVTCGRSLGDRPFRPSRSRCGARRHQGTPWWQEEDGRAIFAQARSANVFIEAKNAHYRFSIAPGFWQWIFRAHSAE